MKKFLQLLTLVALMSVPWAIQAQGFSYSCGFEDDSDTAGWVFVNGTQTNKWFIDTAVAYSGDKSLYISSNNGVSNNYDMLGFSCTYVYREVVIPVTHHYFFKFDWKGVGEVGYDFCRLFLAPTTDTLTAGMFPDSEMDYSSDLAVGAPTGWIAITPSDLSEQSNWQHFEGSVEVAAGTYNLVFVWVNDDNTGENPTIAIDNILIEENNCPNVTNLAASYVGADTVILVWTAVGNETQWLISDGTNEYTATDTTYTIDQLTPNTDYTFTVRAICSATDSSATESVSVHTDCGPVMSLPYFVDFESAAWRTGSSGSVASFTPADCWDYYTNYTSTSSHYPYVSTSYAYSGTKSMYMYKSGSSYHAYFCLPAFEDSTSELLMTMMVRSSYSTSTYGFQVGVMTDPSDMTTFTNVSHIYTTVANTWQEFEVDFSDYTGPSGYITLMCPTSISYGYHYVDDITVMRQPTCWRPTEFAASNITFDSLTLSWTPDSRSTASGFYIEYDTAGFELGTGLNTLTLNSYEESVRIGDLLPRTSYDFYIYSDCSGDMSIPRKLTVQTRCAPFTADDLPYSYGFEGTVSSSTATIDPCWLKYTNYSTAYPYPSSTTPHSGTRCLYFYGSTSYYSYVVLPCFNVQPDSLFLTFWSRSSSTSYSGRLQVGFMTDPSDINTFTLVANAIPNGSEWTLHEIPMGSYTGDGRYIALICPMGSSDYVYLDDITISLPPTCGHVTDLTLEAVSAGAALVSWNPGMFGVYYDAEVEYKLGSDSIWTPITADSTTATFTGLTPGTDYNVRVAQMCDDGSTSTWEYLNFSTRGLGCVEIDTTSTHIDTISGATATTTYNIPVNNFYRNTFSEQLILADEISAGMIEGISFQYNYSSAMTYKTNCSIYLAETSLSSLSTTNWVNPNEMTLVYIGSLNCTTGWNEFTFNQEDFIYSGSGNLVIAVVDNSNNYNGSAYTFNAHSISGKAVSWYSDGSAWNNQAPSSSHSFRNNMKLRISDCVQIASCAPPSVMTTAVNPTEVSIMWLPGYDESSWDVEYKLVSDTLWTSAVASTSATNYTFTNLLPNTAYDFRVVSLCTDENLPFEFTLTTPCMPDTIPFSENFDTWATGYNFPACWYKGTNYSSTNYPSVSSSYAHSGNRDIYLYSTSSTYSYMTLPKFNVPVDSLQVSFWLYRSNSTYTHAISVGVMTDPEDFDTYTELYVATPNMISVWEPFEFPLNNYTGRDGYIAFVSPNGVYSYPYLDDIEVTYIPSCPRPRNVNATSITTTSATINWSDTIASQYVIEYGPSGFEHGTGTVAYATDDSLAITGLTPSSRYDVYVRALCTDSDSSMWSFCYSFNTACGNIASLPYSDNLNSWGSGSSVHAPYCWTYGSGYSTSYPYISNSYSYGAAGGSFYMYTDPSGNTYFQLPPIDSTLFTANQLFTTFYTYRSTTSYDMGVIVGVSTTPDLTGFVPVDTVMVNYGQWDAQEIYFDQYTGVGKYITFVAYCPDSYSYPYIDNISLDLIPSCPRVTNLASANATSNSVDLSWVDHGSNTPSSWIIEYGPQGFSLGTGTQVSVTTNPVTLTNLPTSMQCDFYVRPVCSASDTGTWNLTPGAFATSQVPATLPYSYDFENAAEWANWQTNSNDTIHNWYRGSAVAGNGTYSMYVSPDTGATYSCSEFSSVLNTAVWRDIDFGNIDSSYTLRFKAIAGGTTTASYDGLMVFLVDPSIPVEASSSAITTPWGNVNDLYRIATVRLDTAWNTFEASFDTISGIHRVAFFWFNQSTGDSDPYIGGPAAVDDIEIFYSPCPRPVNLSVVSVGQSSATVTWDGDPTANYRLAYREYPDGTTNTYVNVTGNTYTFSGLTSLTGYAFFVQKLCGNDSSLFSDGITFNTTICDGATIVDLANAGGTAGTTSYAPAYSFYNYGYSATIIDAAELVGMSEITAFGFSVAADPAGSYYNNCRVWLGHTTKTVFSSSTDYVPINDSTFTLVYTGSLNNVEGLNLFMFDTVFEYDGESNVMLVVDRDHGSYQSGNSFNTHTCTGVKTIYQYSDSYNVDPYNPSLTTSNWGSGSWRTDYQLISCGQSCRTPIIASTTQTYNTIDMAWISDGTDFEVAYKEASAGAWSVETPVQGNSYTFTGLTPATAYEVRVRQNCDSIGYSEWAVATVITDSLPCFAPTDLQVTATGFGTVTLDWTLGSTETQWVVNVFRSDANIMDTVTAHPATISGLYAGMEYSASVQAMCGGGAIYSDWSDTVTFTTNVCEPVTNVEVSEITSSSVKVDWTPAAGSNAWQISYGEMDFTEGQGSVIDVNAHPYVVNGLESNFYYDVYVRTKCDESSYSVWSSVVQFQTTSEGIADIDGADINIYPNPTSGNTTISVSGANGLVKVEIVDINGRTVVSESMECTGDCVKKMDVNALAQGAYFVRITGENVNAVKKLIVR